MMSTCTTTCAVECSTRLSTIATRDTGETNILSTVPDCISRSCLSPLHDEPNSTVMISTPGTKMSLLFSVGKPGSWVMFLNSWPKMISQMRGCTNVKCVFFGLWLVFFLFLLFWCFVSVSMMIPLTDLYSRAYFLSCQQPLAFQAWVSSSDQGEAGVSVCSGLTSPTSSAGEVGAVCFAAPPALVC